MAEKQEFTRVSAPPRPTITLPPRPSVDGGFGAGASPGPLTMVSRFFSDCYSDPEYRSFSQLLAGAMQSPMAGAKPEGEGWGKEGGGGGEKILGFKQSRPVGLVVAQPPYFTVPPGLSPSGLLNSPGFFSPESPYGMSHQQALAQVTAQAALSQSHLHFDSAYAPSLAMASAEPSTYQTSFYSNATTNHQMQPSALYAKSSRTQPSDVPSSDKKPQPSHLVVDKPADDGFNWRKYGQKQVKGSEYPRSYYKCTHLNCPVKKQVERSLDGHISEIVYRGQHNHEQPQPSKRSKDSSDLNRNLGSQANREHGSHGQNGNVIRSNETVSAHSMPGRDEESVQLSRSSNREEVDSEMNTEDYEDDDDEPNPKRRNSDNGTFEVASSQKTVAEPKIIVQTRSEVDLLDDGYRWRKYGQKVVKGNPHPRSYYRCTYTGCNVRKHVERASADPKAVITTYEGKHNHDLPAARTSSHNTANNTTPQLKAPSVVGEKHALLKEMGYGNAQRPVVLQLKEEQVLA